MSKKRYVNVFPVPRGFDELPNAYENLCSLVLVVIAKVWFEAYQYNGSQNEKDRAKNLFEQYRRVHCQCQNFCRKKNGYHRNLAGRKILGAVENLLRKYSLSKDEAPFSIGKLDAKKVYIYLNLL